VKERKRLGEKESARARARQREKADGRKGGLGDQRNYIGKGERGGRVREEEHVVRRQGRDLVIKGITLIEKNE